MNLAASSQSRVRRWCGVLCSLVFLTKSANAFILLLYFYYLFLGSTLPILVKGPPGGTGTVAVQSVTFGTPGVVQLNSTLPQTGPGKVTLVFSSVSPGTTTIFIDGTYAGSPGFNTTFTITVPPASTSTAQNPYVGIGGDPINTRTGEYFGIESVDLNLGGPMPLIFARYVASRLAADGVADGNLGQNRLHNFASKLNTLSATLKQVILPNGRVLSFQKTGTKWNLVSPLDVPFILIESGTNFLLGHPHTKQIWTYDNTGKLTKIEDGKGNAHTLTYTGTKLTSVSDGLGRTINISQPGTTITSVAGVTGVETRIVTFAYTSGVLTSATDYGGHTTTYGNSAGLPTSVTRPFGNTLFTQLYDANNKVMSQTERGTDTSTLGYAPTTTTFTDPTLATLVDTYGTDGKLISHADEVGNVISMTYDSAGRRNSVTDRLGNKITTLYHALSGLPSTRINAEGKSILFTYKARTLSGIAFQDLVKITYPDLASRAFVYDAKGNLTQITDETGKIWKFTYNTRGQVLTSINPLGGVTTNTYDGFGNLDTSVAPDVGTTIFDYDDRHRLTQITKPGGATVVVAYDTKDRITSITDERGKIYGYAYDSNNRLTTITDPDNEVTSMGHDVLDRVTSITDAHLNQATVTLDSRRLLSTRTDGNGNTEEMNYDSRQRLTGIEDAGGQMWSFGYDDEGRLTQTQSPIDPPAKRKLNKLGYPIELSDPLGNTRRLTRDAMQRVTQSFDPLGRLTSFVYDKKGRLISATEQGTGTAKYDRDALGNVTKITDPNGGAWTTTYLKSGRVQKMTDPLGKSLTFTTYDTRGRPTVLTFADSSFCTLVYDAASHLTSSTFSAGPNLAFTYDDLGRLASANDVIFEHDSVGRLTNCQQNGQSFTATYDDGDRLQTVSYLGGAFTVTYAYDSRNRLTSVTDSEGTVVALGYDNAGRLTSQTRTPGIDGIYTYDAAGRLTRIQECGIIDLSYTLNAASEVTDVDFTAPSVPSVPAGTQLLKFGKAGEITTLGYTYDLRGRLTAAPVGRTYQWDGASRLTNASGTTLAYNGLGDIITRADVGGTTRYYHHYALGLAPIVYEDPPTGSDRAYVWTPGGRLLYSVDLGTGDPTFYHFDRMGSTLALTDKTDAVTDSYAYGPYGEPLVHAGSSSQPFTYIGAFGVRQEGPLYQMRARYYDPQAARFLSRDPLPPRLSDPKSTNRYAYAAQNPLMYLDPRGTDEFEFTSRVRINFDASGETDGGLKFGGRIRLQYDEPDEQNAGGTELSAAMLYAEASGFRVEVGNSNTAFDSLAGLYDSELGDNGDRSADQYVTGSTGTVGADFGGIGIFASYSVGDLAARLSYISPDSLGSLETLYNSETGYIGSSTGSVCSHYTAAIAGANPGDYDLQSDSPAADLNPDLEDLVQGIGATYDLGGATIGGTILQGFSSDSYADVGVNFSF